MGLLSTLGSLLGSVSTADNIFNAVTGLFSGSQPSAQAAVTTRQAQLLSGGFAGPTLSTGTSVGPAAIQALTTAAQIGGPPLARLALPAVARIAGQVPVPQFLQQEAAAGRAGGVRSVTRRQLILMQARAFNPGATAKKIIKAAKDCGIELAAATFGLNVLDVCFLLAQPPSRRSRGISAADMRRTRSTIRKVHTIQRQLTAIKPAARRKH